MMKNKRLIGIGIIFLVLTVVLFLIPFSFGAETATTTTVNVPASTATTAPPVIPSPPVTAPATTATSSDGRIQGAAGNGQQFPTVSSSGSFSGSSGSGGGSFSSFNAQFYEPYLNAHQGTGRQDFETRYQDYWPILADANQCGAGQDFLVQISPLGCTPTVVRSDLLEDQNVPVFCQLNALKLNPLIDVEAIDYITLKDRSSSPFISGVGFHPAQAAIKSSESKLLGSPLLNNIGYAVIVLKKTPAEKDMPEVVEGNLTAVIRYNLENVFGIGNREFYLPLLNDQQWQEDYKKYGFWKGKGYLRADSIDQNTNEARIVVYSDVNHERTTLNLDERQSKQAPIPGYYCSAYMDVQLHDISAVDTTAIIKVDNDYYEVREGQRFLDNKCTIRNIEKTGIYEKVTVSCNRNKDVILEFAPKVKIKYKDLEQDYALGERISIIDGKSVYLSYVGELRNPLSNKNTPIIVLSSYAAEGFGDKLTVDELKRMSSHMTNVYSATRANSALYNAFVGDPFLVLKANIADVTDKLQGRITVPYALGGTTDFSSDVKQVTFVSFSGPADFDYSSFDNGVNSDGKKFEDLFKTSLKTYEEVSQNFPTEKVNELSSETYAEQALWKAQEFAQYAGKYKTQYDLLNTFIEKYPSSPSIDKAKELRDSIALSNGGISSALITIDEQSRAITLDKVSKPACDEYGIIVSIKKKTGEILLDKCIEHGESVYITGGSNEFIKLEGIDNQQRAKISYFFENTGFKETVNQLTTNTQTLTLNTPWGYGNYVITMNKVNYRPAAHIILTPQMKDVRTETNISFKIGIEKRAIQLSPEKISNRIKYLDDQIVKWQKVSDSLAVTVKGLKTACLATGAVLTVTNFFSDAGGKGYARTQVMRSAGGWNDKCSKALATGTLDGKPVVYKSLDECYIKNSDQIDKEVNEWYNVISKQNQDIKTLEEGKSENSILGEKVIDDNKFMPGFIDSAKNDLTGVNLQDCKVDNVALDFNEAASRIKIENWKDNLLSQEDVRNVQLYSRVLKTSSDSDVKAMASKQLCDSLGSVYKKTQENTRASSLSQKLKDKGLGDLRGDNYGDKNAVAGIYRGNTLKGSQLPDFTGKENDKSYAVQRITYNNADYLLVLAESGSVGVFTINQIFNISADGNLGSPVGKDSGIGLELARKFTQFKQFDAKAYQNRYLKPELRYYETEPYKGLPGVVPFDCAAGWYAGTKQTLPIFGAIKAFDDSGRVTSFSVCNVGENGREEFDQKNGDDICELVNLGTGQPYDVFPGLGESEAKSLIQKASKAIQTASQKYASKGKTIQINDCKADVKTQVDTPAIQCSDMMSPSECQLMFNVCDPVICPNSRCDLGGQYRVNDVIQSGIIGSVALCLPNYRQGIVVPVCLTGIQAGIDGVNSIFKASRDCLQEQLTSGKTVGICDEIQSIYMCDLFWREAAPISKIIIPKLVEFATGQNVRGGGEYLGVQDAWNNAEKSVSYLRDYYGANAYKAFKARSTDEVGSTVCKAFVSAKYPGTKGFLDALTEPDSPTQYHAWFSETPFSSVTVPATSQYKVFYHIYAGKDTGAYFSVYLKSPPGLSGFYENPQVQVASGFIAKGSFADATRDFTAPAGYKQLCISVNGQEECGFERVTTSFALEYLKEQYLADQASQTNIKSQKDCVSGTSSLYSLAQPNLQTGVEETVNPKLYDYGIIRVCATDNPGVGTDSNALDPGSSRWKQVGVCEGNLKCWVDTQSIASQIKIGGIQNETLTSVTDQYVNQLKGQPGYKDEITIEGDLEKITVADTTDINVNQKIQQVDEVMKTILLNYQRAKALILKGEIYQQAGKVVLERIRIRAEGSAIENYVRNGADNLAIAENQKKVEAAAEKESGKVAAVEKRADGKTVSVHDKTANGLHITTDLSTGTKGVQSDIFQLADNTNYYYRFVGESKDKGNWEVLVVPIKISVDTPNFPSTSYTPVISTVPVELGDYPSDVSKFVSNPDSIEITNVFNALKGKTYAQGFQVIYNKVTSEQLKLAVLYPDKSVQTLEHDDLPLYNLLTIAAGGEVKINVNCEQCGEGSGVCNEEGCKLLARESGKNCVYEDKFFLAPGGTCTEKAADGTPITPTPTPTPKPKTPTTSSAPQPLGKNTCEECGNEWFGICDEQECQQISSETGKNCLFEDSFGPGGSCTEQIGKPVTPPVTTEVVSIDTHFDNSQLNTQDFTGSFGNKDKEEAVTKWVKLYSQRYDLNFNLVRALIKQESDWDSNAGGDIGLMQITADPLMVSDIGQGRNCQNICSSSDIGEVPHNTADLKKLTDEKNIHIGTCYLACLRGYYKVEDARTLVAAYNAGPSSLSSECKQDYNQCSSLPSTTKNIHVPNIVKNYGYYSKGSFD